MVLLGIGVAYLSPAAAQEPQAEPVVRRPYGFRIRSASGHLGYFSSVAPPQDGIPPGNLDLDNDMEFGGTADLGFDRRPGLKTQFSVHYAPTLTATRRYMDWNSLDHSLSLRVARPLGRAWQWNFSIAGATSNLRQYLFLQSRISQVIAAPASFDELAVAVLTGRVGTGQLATILTSATLLESPARTLLYGSRSLSTSAVTSLSYRPSARLNLQFDVGASRHQPLTGGTPSNQPEASYLLPRTSSGTASGGLTYSLSQRTQVGVSLGTIRIASPFHNGYNSTLRGSIGRRMGRSWLLNLSGGAGAVTNDLRQSLSIRGGPQYLAGGWLGFQVRPHTFLASYERTAGDSFGLGSLTSTSTNGSWRWSDRNWTLTGTVGHQILQGGVFDNLQGLVFGAGVTRRLTRRTSLLTEYAYLRNRGRATISSSRLEIHSVRLMLTWSPDAEILDAPRAPSQ